MRITRTDRKPRLNFDKQYDCKLYLCIQSLKTDGEAIFSNRVFSSNAPSRHWLRDISPDYPEILSIRIKIRNFVLPILNI